jgi:carboxyl-terminal processing protease
MPKNFRIFSIAVLSILLLFLAFAMGWSAGTGTTLFSHGANARLLNQAWTTITQNYVEPSVANSTILNEGAVKGMVQALNDPYSSYLSPDVYKLAQSGIQGTFSGIGAQVGLNNANQPVVLAPIEDSPASKAGVKTGDVILAVNGESTKGLSLTEVTLLIRGPVGTTVKLLIQHEGETTPVEIDIVRAQINAPTVAYKMMGSIAYIDIASFNENTNDELNAGLQALDLKDSTGIILDLRDNPGGLTSDVVDVASHFIKSGVIITLVDNKGDRSSQSVQPNGVYTDLPMVVLVNQYTASGSEVLSGALQDYHRATIAGNTTLGKGSYDSFFQLSDGSAIYLTIGRWLTPDGREIEGKGITPDYVLTQTGDQEIQWAIDYLNKAQPK